ncbi:MAG: fatty acid desaturase family protein [Ilumatobacteraceae bacterium]
MSSDAIGTDRMVLRAEHQHAAKYWGGFQWRIVVTFVVFAAAWTTVLALGIAGAIPLWIGLIVNTVLATTFYMPMHEAVHRNITGSQPKGKRLEDLIGRLCSIPVGISFAAHRGSHMRHHAFTNDPDRDPDHFTDGRLAALPAKWLAVVAVNLFLPVVALVPPTRRLLPAQLRRSLAAGNDRSEGLSQVRFWALTHLVLLAAFLLGVGWPVLLLWYVPARLQAAWLLFIFAWYPHHPASHTGRYADTRVAVFPGSRWLIRGHDHHAMHHMFPRVPHYHLRALWRDVAEDMVAKGVRAEGSAVAATGPVVW